jgi:hypothetical protein
MGYRFDFLRPDHEYYSAWCEYRRLRRNKWIALLAFVPTGIAVAILLAPLSFALKSEIPAFGAGLLLLSAIAVTHLRQLYWKCPKCGRPFFLAPLSSDPFADNCRHCRLPLYAPCDPAKQEWERV